MTQPCTEKDTLKRIEDKIDEMHAKMFIGNGTPSLLVRVDRLETFKAAAMWAIGLVTGGGLVWGAMAIVQHVFKVVG